MATVTKRDIIVHITNQLEKPTQEEVAVVVQATLDFLVTSLANGDEVTLRNFGTFEVKTTPQKIGRNPRKPNSEVVIPARAVARFKPGKELREKVAQVLPKLLTANSGK
jgi:nucleoid DNA-binding protein